jgi:PKD repeat protein
LKEYYWMSSIARSLLLLRRPVRLSGQVLAAAFLLLAGRPALGAGSPGSPPPGPTGSNARWNNASSLKPAAVPILEDSTWFAGHSEPRAGEVRQPQAVDIENGILFAATGEGLKIFDVTGGPTATESSFIYGYWNGSGSFPGWQHVGDANIFITDLDAPAGNSSIVALGMTRQGFAIVRTSNPASPVVAYYALNNEASSFLNISQVYAVRAAGADWAYGLNGDAKIVRYSLTAASTLTTCVEVPPVTTCPNVFKGVVTSLATNPWHTLHGVGNFLATGNKFSQGAVVKIWSLSDPATPSLLLQINAKAVSVAMWQSGSSYYLARLDPSNVLTIHDVSCIAGGACSNAPAVWQKQLTAPLPLTRVTVSQASGRTYLYAAGGDLGSCVPQREYLFDVTTPATASLDDLTPKIHADGYWGWYYQDCPTGFNLVGPRIGKVYTSTNGTHLYRAAYSLLDAHTINVQSGPPTAAFSWSPTSGIYPGTPVQFTDQSSGSPTSWNWTFTGGTPSQAQNPAVTFASEGQKSVTLEVANQFGAGTPATQTLTVLDPAPQLAGITVTPASPLVCQPVTMTAVEPGGQPPLQYAWAVENTSGTVFSQTNTNTSQVWNTTGAAAGSYTGKLTLSNGVNNVVRTAPIVLGALPALPLSGQFTPTKDPFTAGTVTFHVVALGATEWNWDFDGDGVFQESGWTNDPVTGPNPTHSYSSTGVRQVRVKVRNCVETTGALSAPVEVNITQVTPLSAHFQANELCPGICFVDAGSPVPFIDASTGAELWDYDWDGNGTYEDAGNTAPRSSHTYSATGTFTPKLRVRRGASEEDVDVHDFAIQVGASTPPGITVSGPSSGLTGASLTFSASGTGSCSPAASGWTWNLGGGTAGGSTTGSSVTISWSSAGGKSISASNSACGSASGSKSVTITATPTNPPTTLNAQFTYTPAAPKAAEAVSFTSSSTGSPTNYSWNFGDGSALASGVQTSHTYATAGLYLATLTVTKESTACPPAPFCESTVSKQVSVTANVAAQPGTLRFSLGSYAVSEGAGSVAISVQRVSGDDGAVSVQYAAAAGLATAGQDFTPVTGALSWADNDTGTKSFNVVIGNDSVAEANETVLLTLSAPTGGAVIDPTRLTATLTIQDDDGTPGATLVAPSALTAGQDSTTTVQVAWVDNSNNETGFSIEARTIAGSFQEIATVAANATSTIVAGLDPSTFYLFRVRATAGTSSSPYSNEASATTLGNPGSCVAGAQALCLNHSRFRVKVDWRIPDGTTGAGQAVPIPSAPDSGLFYFFSPVNIELLVKQLNACADPFNHYWTFYAATTNVEFALVVTDTQNGQTKGYFNPLNHSAAPVQDIHAFATCP